MSLYLYFSVALFSVYFALFWFAFYLSFRCLFSNERERKGMDSGGWGGGERPRKSLGRRNHNQNVLHEKKSVFN